MQILKMKELENIQNEYADLIESYSNAFKSDSFDYSAVSSFIEEVELFWLKRLDSVRILLDMLTSENECYVLSGAIYLDSKNNEHFPLKALGDYQIIYDPFIKMEPFIRNKLTKMGNQNIPEFFIKVFKDIYNILTNLKNDFIILPVVHLAWELETDKHMKILQGIHLNFLSGILGEKINSIDHFYELYKTYDQINKNLDEFYLKNLIFNGLEDEKIKIDERINKYIINNFQEMDDTSDAEKFMISTFTMIAQITDILLIALNLRLVPFIRYSVTFRYFLMMNKLFSEDKETKSILNKSIIAYLFYEKYPPSFFSDLPYNEFVNQLQGYNLIDEVSKSLNLSRTDLENYSVQKVIETIIDNFDNRVIKKLKPNWDLK